MAPKKSQGQVLRLASAVLGGSGEAPRSSREALGDSGRLRRAQKAPGRLQEVLGRPRELKWRPW